MEKKKIKNERVLYYDILNILACFCVILLHCNGMAHVYSNNRGWYISLFVDCIACWAVPVFFMLTGATLMNYRKKYDTKTFFKKRVLKTLIPFIVWATIVFIWKKTNNIIKIDDLSIRGIMNFIILDNEEVTYWFFWAIFSIYLCLPVLSHLTEEKHRKTLWYIAIVSAIFNSAPGLLNIIGISWNDNFKFNIAGGYLMYVVFGYLLSTQEIKKRWRIIIYILGICAILIKYIGTVYYSTKLGVINKFFWDYPLFVCLFIAVAVFVFIKSVNYNNIKNNVKITNIISKISACSFGIYLIHRIVMYYQLHLLSINDHSWQWRSIGAITTYLIALAIVLVLRKIPIIKKIVP